MRGIGVWLLRDFFESLAAGLAHLHIRGHSRSTQLESASTLCIGKAGCGDYPSQIQQAQEFSGSPWHPNRLKRLPCVIHRADRNLFKPKNLFKP
jgi:hypothetical protein